MPVLGVENFLRTTLSAPLTAAATAASITSTARFPSSGYVVIWPASQGLTPPVGDPDSLGVEIASYAAVGAGQLTGLARGLGNTAAKNHNTPGETYYVAISWVTPYVDDIVARLLDTSGTDRYLLGGLFGIGRVPAYVLDLAASAARIRLRDDDAGSGNPSLEFLTSVDSRLVILEAIQASAVARLTAAGGTALELGAGGNAGRIVIASSGDVTIPQTLAVTGGLAAGGDVDAAGGFIRSIGPFYESIFGGTQSPARADLAYAPLARFIAPRAGSLRAISTWIDAAITAGTVTCQARINGVATTLQQTLNSGSGQSLASTMAKDVEPFAAGDEIGVFVSTSSYTGGSAHSYLDIEC